jgi:phosphatidylethanolamine/phosphatidyl-N-methylethanolamine N-methyltransferase
LSATLVAMNQEEVKSIYGKYSSVYDKVFAQFFRPRIKIGIEKSGIRSGHKVIEVGVGTGISLPLYPAGCKVVGVDLTRKMLDKAQEKKELHRLDNVELLEMDAENLTFDDDTFDHSLAAFVITVVPNPEKMVSEMKRVTKKGGNILIFNHFSSKNPFIRGMNHLFSPLTEKVGWRSDVTLDLLSNHCNLQITSVLKKTAIDPWSIIIANNNK